MRKGGKVGGVFKESSSVPPRCAACLTRRSHRQGRQFRNDRRRRRQADNPPKSEFRTCNRSIADRRLAFALTNESRARYTLGTFWSRSRSLAPSLLDNRLCF